MKSVELKIDTYFTSDEAIAAWREGARVHAEKVLELLRPAAEYMDDACLLVLALGYRADQCEIVHEQLANGCGEKRTLEVLGKPCFEVTIETLPMTAPDYKIEVVTTPRVIEWPPQVVP